MSFFTFVCARALWVNSMLIRTRHPNRSHGVCLCSCVWEGRGVTEGRVVDSVALSCYIMGNAWPMRHAHAVLKTHIIAASHNIILWCILFMSFGKPLFFIHSFKPLIPVHPSPPMSRDKSCSHRVHSWSSQSRRPPNTKPQGLRVPDNPTPPTSQIQHCFCVHKISHTHAHILKHRSKFCSTYETGYKLQRKICRTAIQEVYISQLSTQGVIRTFL